MNEGICERTEGKEVEEKLVSRFSRWSNIEEKRTRDTVAGADEFQWSAIRGEPSVANEVRRKRRSMEEEGAEKDATLAEGRRWKRVDDQERARSGGRSVRGVVSVRCGGGERSISDYVLG
ncbi:unnamed protein product [Lactuca saligna]|uniref:Uncharacterized protein n=1 Tax=Lactuca saligna TaxID=75948 RepID=A0AA36E7M8_LACSI|nr:unnamed protein product [Lactuca saligna]